MEMADIKETTNRIETIKLISFDLDATLTTSTFVDSVWQIGVPRLYAEQHATSFEKAQKHILHQYASMGDNDLRWYDLPFWFKYFKLEADPEELLDTFKHTINLYPDVIPTLQCLQPRYPLIIISNADRIFLDLEVKEARLGQYFEKIFSATSDFGKVKREEEMYRAVCDLIGISPHEVMHIGDHWEFDFATPSRIGIQSYFLDRAGSRTGASVLHSLDELQTIFHG
jgi:putative hydrolase of the HAD superfamily